MSIKEDDDPAAYLEPPPPTRPSHSFSWAHRVEVLRRRRARGRGLFHPADLVQLPADEPRPGDRRRRGRRR